MTIRNQIRSGRVPLAAFALAGLLLLCGHAGAAPLLPGAPAETTPGTDTFAGLTPVADESFTITAYDQSSNPRFTATVESRVLEEPSGTLDFAYQVTNDVSVGEPDSIEFVTLTNYSKFTTDADFVAGTGNVAYKDIQRASAVGGFQISMDYSPVANNIANGDSTDWVLIKTNATSYDNNGTTNLQDGATASVASFEPVPEPISLGILAVGGAVMLANRPGRRSRTVA